MRQFLSLAAPSAVNLEPVVVSEVVRYVAELLRPDAEARGIALTLDLPDALPVLTADPAQLKQALVNLVINALQAVPRGGGIAVAARVHDGTGALDLEVSDNGPGVPRERRAAIFEPFFTTKSDGSGLGLWIVQQIASAHGGTVTLATPEGGGASFTMRLPLRRSDPHG
jgi:signal transduction histidine kinase